MHDKKAQMSLEMVIGLLILLVVAAVVIRIFLTQIKGIDETSRFMESLEYQEFENKCESLCNEFMGENKLASGVQYCVHRLFSKGSKKLGKKGVVDAITIADDILPLTKGFPVCEDSVFCFHTVECKGDVGPPLDWEDCAQILCSFWLNTYDGNRTKASAAVVDDIPDAGSCYIPDNENWWELYFGDTPCGGSGTTSQSLSLTNCQLDKNTNPWSFSCDTNCQEAQNVLIHNATGPDAGVAVVNDPDIQNGKVRGQPLPNLGAGLLKLNDLCVEPSTWTVKLRCASPDQRKETGIAVSSC